MVLQGHCGRLRTLATGTGKTVIFWDLTDPTHPRRLGQPPTGHTDVVSSVAFRPDGRTLATASSLQMAILWDLTERTHPRPVGEWPVEGLVEAAGCARWGGALRGAVPVPDIEAALAAVTAAGGEVVSPVTDSPGFGRWAECHYDHGVRFGVRQPS